MDNIEYNYPRHTQINNKWEELVKKDIYLFKNQPRYINPISQRIQYNNNNNINSPNNNNSNKMNSNNNSKFTGTFIL